LAGRGGTIPSELAPIQTPPALPGSTSRVAGGTVRVRKPLPPARRAARLTRLRAPDVPRPREDMRPPAEHGKCRGSREGPRASIRCSRCPWKSDTGSKEFRIGTISCCSKTLCQTPLSRLGAARCSARLAMAAEVRRLDAVRPQPSVSQPQPSEIEDPIFPRPPTPDPRDSPPYSGMSNGDPVRRRYSCDGLPCEDRKSLPAHPMGNPGVRRRNSPIERFESTPHLVAVG